MDSNIDFTYFNSAPLPYPYYPNNNQEVNNPSQYDEYRHAQGHEQYDPAFATFHQNFPYDPSNYAPQPQSGRVPSTAPPNNQHRHTPTLAQPEHAFENIQPHPQDIGQDDSLPIGRSSSEEKDSLTPQQNKRKAQNRAAQRAFRERKEKHVKDLEARNTTLQHESLTLQNEVERLRRELSKVATENEILRATSGSSSNGPTPFMTEPDELVGPLGYTPTDYSSKVQNSGEKPTEWNPNAKWAQFGSIETIAVDDDSGEPLLTAGATWDYIQAHELYKKGLVDVGDVCERLKKMARCDGQGPVFQESDIRSAIMDSAVAGGRDELI